MEVAGGIYRDPHGYFEFSFPRDGWSLLSSKASDLTLWNARMGAGIVVNVSALQEDRELSILTRHLLIAFERKRVISRETAVVDGKEAVRAVVEGWIEKSKVMAEVYVVKGEGVVYDIVFWSPTEVFAQTVQIFQQFLGTLHFVDEQEGN